MQTSALFGTKKNFGLIFEIYGVSTQRREGVEFFAIFSFMDGATKRNLA